MFGKVDFKMIDWAEAVSLTILTCTSSDVNRTVPSDLNGLNGS